MRIAVATTGRQDWGILRSTCRLLAEDTAFDLRLLVGGMHCSAAHGSTIELIERDGFAPAARMHWVEPGRTVTEETAAATAAVGAALAEEQPDALMLVGDRFETAGAALAATLQRVPLVHLHGGEETEGAFDNALRHAVTKLSHLHLVSHPDHARRVIAMGEDPAAVHVVGAPGLDNLHRADLADRAELETFLGLELRAPVVIVTVHPTTLAGDPLHEIAAVVSAMQQVDARYVVTLPNVDPGHEVIVQRLRGAAVPGRIAIASALGERRFWGLMRIADAILGNSSSALIEAPVLRLPAVNVGDRQKGRVRGANVIDVPPEEARVADALRQALSPSFRVGLLASSSPFGDGHAGERIVNVLRKWTPPHPPLKPAVRW